MAKNCGLAVLLLLIFLIPCTCTNQPTNPPKGQNHKPEIIALSADPHQVGPEQSCTLSVNVVDKDGDDLSYQWSSDTGYFMQGTRRKFALWKAPQRLGSYECKVTVSDGVTEIDSSISIEVVEIPYPTFAPEELNFGHNLDTLAVYITKTGNPDLHWQVIASRNWIHVSPTSGSTSTEIDEVMVTIDRTGLPAGDYDGIVGIRSNGGSYDFLVYMAVAIESKMVMVPAGEFIMGSKNGNEDEQPVHSLYLDDFYIDKYEVTNAQYADFLNEAAAAGEISPGSIYKDGKRLLNLSKHYKDKHNVGCAITYINGSWLVDMYEANTPIRNVSWYGALAYATHYGKRLPTEAEWEKAARGTKALTYPWGNTEPTQWHCNYSDNIDHPTVVGRYSPLGDSPYGCCDMAGNVWEWCSSLYQPYPYSADDGREDLTDPGYRVVRGGRWGTYSDAVRSSLRNYNRPTYQHISFGFRCAK